MADEAVVNNNDPEERKVPPENVEFIFSIAEDRVKSQVSSCESLDAKAGILLGFEALIFTTLLGHAQVTTIFVFLELAIIFIAIILDILALVVKNIELDPHPYHLYMEYGLADLSEIKRQVMENLVVCYKENEDFLHQKSQKINLSMFLLSIGLLMAAGGYVFTK